MKDSSIPKNIKVVHLKPLSVKLKRLRWKEVMKRKFWEKNNLLRPCISRICRQLLNIELKMREKARKPLSCIKDNSNESSVSRKTSLNAASEENIRESKPAESVEDPEPPRKKLKQGDENCPTSVEKSPETSGGKEREEPSNINSFKGFETTSSVRLKKCVCPSTQNVKDSPKRNSISFMTKSGVKTIATKAISLPRSKSLSSMPSLKSVNSSPKLNSSNTNQDSGIILESDLKLANPVPEVIDEPAQRFSLIDHDKDSEGIGATNGCPEIIDTKEEEDDEDEDEDGRSKSEMSVEDVEALNKMKEDPPATVTVSEKEKETTVNLNEVKKETSVNLNEKEDKSNSETVTKKEVVCHVGELESSPSSPISDEENVDTSFDPTKFLSCDISTDTVDDQSSNEDIPFIKSQNFQLNCNVQINLVPLLIKDITNMFCYKHNISGICGFRLRRLLQKMEFKTKYFKPCYIGSNSSPETVDKMSGKKKGQKNGKNDDAYPSAVSFEDPFTHSLFAPIIKKDRPKSSRVKKYSLSGPNNNKFKPKSSQFPKSYPNEIYYGQGNQPLNHTMGTLFRHNHFGPRHVITHMQHRFNSPHISSSSPFVPNVNISVRHTNVPNSGSFHVAPTNFNGTSGTSTSVTPLVQHNDTSSNIGSYKPGDILKSIVVGNTPISQSLNTLPPLPPNANIVLPQLPLGSNYSYVVLPRGASQPSVLQIHNGSVHKPFIYQTLAPPNHIQTTPVQTSGHVPSTPVQTPGHVPSTPAAQSSLQVSPIIPGSSSSTSLNLSNPTSAPSITVPTSNATIPGISFSVPIPNVSGSVCTTTNSSFNTCISNPHNPGPPPLKLGNAHLGKPMITPSNYSLSQPPQLKKMGITVVPPVPRPHIVRNHEDKEEEVNNSRPNISKWLLDLYSAKQSCSRKGISEYDYSTLRPVISYLKIFLSFGFTNKASSVLNAAYQMLTGTMCCPLHALELVRKSNLLKRLETTSLIIDQNEYAAKDLPIPNLPRSQLLTPFGHHPYEMFILKRFVFAVDRETRVVLYPLPPFCIPKENNHIDKITVVALISPHGGLGPGLIVFPHSILDRKLRLSLGDLGCLGRSWVVSAHQRGGLTQSMMIEFLNGEGMQWLLENNAHRKSAYFAVDWWWCIEMKDLDSFFGKFKAISLQQIYPSHRDPLDICLSVTLERLWGLLIRKWSAVRGPLCEHQFPKFIHKALNELCEPSRLQAWCRSAGLYPIDHQKSRIFLDFTADTTF